MGVWSVLGLWRRIRGSVLIDANILSALVLALGTIGRLRAFARGVQVPVAETVAPEGFGR